MTFATRGSACAPALSDWLATRTQEQLTEILENRPDAAVPLPANISALATRLLLRSSLSRALSHADAAEIALLEQLCAQGAELEAVSSPPSQPLQSLKAKALVYGDEKVSVPGPVISALPSGFSVINQVPVSAESIRALPAEQLKILKSLVDTGLGTTRDAAPDAPAERPIPQLLAAGLLERVDNRTVRLPRSVREVLKGQDPVIIPLEPSGRAGTPTPDPHADEAGAAAGLEVVRLMGSLIEILGQRPVELLKDKSVGVRQVQALGKELETSHAARLIALGLNARLLGRGEPDPGPEGNFLAPCGASAEWLDAPLKSRLEFLQQAWLSSPWAAWQSARALDKETSHDFLPRHKRTLLDIYRHSAVPLKDEQFREDLRFSRPLFATHTQPATIDNLLDEAKWLGIIAHGVLTQSRPVPAAISYFIIQADMTVLAPGPLETPVLKKLSAMADMESPGLASVYRLSAHSLRRGLDSGATAAELKQFLRDHAVGQVPQAVDFAIDEAARNHGALRAGPAMCYLRSEDEALVAQAVATLPALRLLAPTVAVSTQPLAAVLDALRQAGFSPAVEDSTGATINAAPTPALLPTPRATPPRPAPEVSAAEAAAALLAADAPATAPAPESSALDVLAAAARASRLVTVGYADKQGQTRTLKVTPITVSGGQVDAIAADGRPVRIPVPRITYVRLA